VFTGEFRGSAGQRQTDTVTAVAVNDRNQPATDSAQATVFLTPAPVPQILVRTGPDVGGPARLGLALLIVGFLMVAATVKSPLRPATALTENVAGAFDSLRDRLPSRSGLWFGRTRRPYVPVTRRGLLRRRPPLRWRGAQASRRRPRGRRGPWGRGRS
jgi:hypothetical protein